MGSWVFAIAVRDFVRRQERLEPAVGFEQMVFGAAIKGDGWHRLAESAADQLDQVEIRLAHLPAKDSVEVFSGSVAGLAGEA